MELQIYICRYRCIYRYVFDASTCRDIGIFTVAVARVKDMNSAIDTFIDTVAHFVVGTIIVLNVDAEYVQL